MNDELEELARLVIARFDQLEGKMAAGFAQLQGSLDAVGGHFAVKLDDLEQKVDRVASDTAALTEELLVPEENARRLRKLERDYASLERSREEQRGRLDEHENRLFVVQASLARKGNGNGSGE